ncbi:unnamed protein product [Urochloa humidicola]
MDASGEQFKTLDQQKNLEEKIDLQPQDIDPWQSEFWISMHTISRVNNNQQWWLSSCTKCHRTYVAHDNQYKCSGECPFKVAEPKYRSTDETTATEFVHFG